MKKCNKCNEIKELSCFGKDSRNSDGLQGICEDCRKIAKQLSRQGRLQGSIPLIKVENKCCNKCNETKHISEFFKDRGIADGHATICKQCKMRSTLSWREKNRSRYNETHKEYNRKNYQKMRLQRYDLTPEQHAKMLYDQKGVCAICSQLPKGNRPLAVDHSHKTGKVRGLLCYGCNRAISILDNQGLLEKAIEYIKNS